MPTSHRKAPNVARVNPRAAPYVMNIEALCAVSPEAKHGRRRARGECCPVTDTFGEPKAGQGGRDRRHDRGRKGRDTSWRVGLVLRGVHTARTHEKSLTQDVAEDVLGAAKDGNVKLLIVKVLIFPIVICQIVKVLVIILSIVICQRRPTPGLPSRDT